MSFKIINKSQKSLARIGTLKTKHGVIKTPFFMPIATRGSVKSLTSEDLKKLGTQIVLANSYHLYLKPGLSVIKKSKGLHQFINWPGPILTDSGGYQVFSLKTKNEKFKTQNIGRSLVKITDQGVEFRSVYDGSKHLFTPKSVIKMQETFGSDIMMVLDVCSPARCSHSQAEKDLEITLKWAKEALKYKSKKENNQLFGIVQGALYKDLRLKSVKALSAIGFNGYAVGGLAVGESPSEMYKVLDYTVPELPQAKPHYLMGVGYPEQIVESVKRGIDMFDCVIPTREARHGRLYIRNHVSRITYQNFYSTINIKAEKFARDLSTINKNSNLPELRHYSKAYLRHLFSVNEPLALRLATLNNLEFYLGLMSEIRESIQSNKL